MPGKMGDPPDYLNAYGLEHWNFLIEQMGDELAVRDRGPLTLLCLAWGYAMDANKDIKDRGLVVDGDRGKVKNPMNQVFKEQSGNYFQLAKDFGLTLASRKRMAKDLEDKSKRDTPKPKLD